MEVTKWLKPSISVSRIGDSASVEQMASTQCACVVGLCQKKSHTMNKKIFRADALFITSQRDSLLSTLIAAFKIPIRWRGSRTILRFLHNRSWSGLTLITGLEENRKKMIVSHDRSLHPRMLRRQRRPYRPRRCWGHGSLDWASVARGRWGRLSERPASHKMKHVCHCDCLAT